MVQIATCITGNRCARNRVRTVCPSNIFWNLSHSTYVNLSGHFAKESKSFIIHVYGKNNNVPDHWCRVWIHSIAGADCLRMVWLGYSRCDELCCPAAPHLVFCELPHCKCHPVITKPHYSGAIDEINWVVCYFLIHFSLFVYIHVTWMNKSLIFGMLFLKCCQYVLTRFSCKCKILFCFCNGMIFLKTLILL